MPEGKQECDFCKYDVKTEDLTKCAYCGRSFCENCIYGTGADAMCFECSMVGRERDRL
jgi:hypothetical protein